MPELFSQKNNFYETFINIFLLLKTIFRSIIQFLGAVEKLDFIFNVLAFYCFATY